MDKPQSRSLFLNNLEQLPQYHRTTQWLKEELTWCDEQDSKNDQQNIQVQIPDTPIFSVKEIQNILDSLSSAALDSTDQHFLAKLRSQLKSVIQCTQCYCNVLVKWLKEQEADTDKAEIELCKINRELEKLKEHIEEQSTEDEVMSNTIKSLLTQLQGITEAMKNTTSLLCLESACTLLEITDSLIKMFENTLSSIYKDEQSKQVLEQLKTKHLKEIKQKIDDYVKCDIDSKAKGGATLSVIALPLFAMAYLVLPSTKTNSVGQAAGVGVAFLGAFVGSDMGRYLGLTIGSWNTDNKMDTGRKKGEDLTKTIQHTNDLQATSST